MKNIITTVLVHPRKAPVFYSALLVLISFLSILPFVHYQIRMDYDSPFSVSAMTHITTPGNAYRPRREPGCPTFDFTVGFLYKGLAHFGVTPLQAQFVFQWFSWICAMILAVLFLQLVSAPLGWRIGCIAAAALVLHPLFLWHEWAFVEDMFALTLCFSAWVLLQRGGDYGVAAILFAIGTAAKGFGLSYAVAAFVYVLFRRGPKTAFLFAFLYLTLFFYFFAPALAYKGMDLTAISNTENYGTTPSERPGIGWLLARDSLLFYIPILFTLIWTSIRRWRKGGPLVESPGDIWLISLLPLCFMDYNKFHYRYLFFAVSFVFLGRLVMDRKNPKSTEALAYWIMVIGTFMIAFTAPYSRSFYLFALPPLILLIAERFKQPIFWIFTVFITFVPMLFYFQFRGKPPLFTVFPYGFYSAHLLSPYHAMHNNEYNDGGLSVLPPVFAWPKRRS